VRGRDDTCHLSGGDVRTRDNPGAHRSLIQHGLNLSQAALRRRQTRPFEILRPHRIWRDGRGIPRADARLHREVAIEVSDEKFSDRFEREHALLQRRTTLCGAGPTPIKPKDFWFNTMEVTRIQILRPPRVYHSIERFRFLIAVRFRERH
jgi:hypothetical protein